MINNFKLTRTLTLTLTLILIIGLTLSSYAYAPYLNQGIPVPEFKGAAVNMENNTEYLGYSKGAELLQNSIFTDANNHWAKRAITRMSGQSVIKGYGEHRFLPDRNIQKQEALALLVRMMGREGIVQENLANQGIGQTGNWAEGYITEAQNMGILTGNEDANFTSSVSREEFAVWTARMLNLQPVYDNIEIIYTFDDWREIAPVNIGTIEAILQERIMQGDSSGDFNPRDSLNRAQIASMLNNISDRLYEERNQEAHFGQIVNIQQSTINESGSSIRETNIIVKNVDGTISTLKAKSQGSTALNDFVVYKNGLVANGSILSIGDEIEYILKDDQVIYVEVYNDGSVLEKIKQNSLNEDNLKTYFGKVTSINREDYWTGQNQIQTDRYRVRNIDGQAFDIVVETDRTTGFKNDIVVYKGSNVGGSSLLQQNDEIEYVVNNNKTIVYAKVTTLNRDVVSGTIKTVNIPENKLSLLDYDDNTKVYGIVPYVDVMINLRPAELSDLKFGQNVTLNVSNGLITSVIGETFMNEPGYIPSNGRTRAGQIQYLSEDSITVRYNDGASESFKVSDYTTILKEGSSIRFRDLREGDRVKLSFDTIYGNEVNRIEIEGMEQLIKNVYKGKIDKVDVSDREITLINPEILKNAQWEELDDYKIDIVMDNLADIYYDGELISISDIGDDHKDDEIYIAIQDSYSKERGIKAVVQRGSERLYTDKVDNINYSGDSLELDNGKNITFGQETIIVKDNRLVSLGSVEQDLSALVVSEYNSGSYRATVISLGAVGGYRMFDNIYIGKIDSIDTDKFEVIWHSRLDDNEWDSVSSSTSRTMDFDYNDDTYITDVTDEYDEISTYDFFHDGYSDEDDEEYYTFIVTEGGRDVIAMTIRQNEFLYDTGINDDDEIEDALEGLLLTKGSVDDIDTLRNRLRISDPYDWSAFYDEWRANRNDEYVDIEQALFIRGDEVIEIDDLDEDDTIYILRNDEDAIIVFVE